MPTLTTDDTQAHMEKLEQRMHQLRTSEGLADWDDFDGTPRMPSYSSEGV